MSSALDTFLMLCEQLNPSKKQKKTKRNVNSYGYDVSKFTVLDIPVRRDSETGRLIRR